jgi:hypothetical protein
MSESDLSREDTTFGEKTQGLQVLDDVACFVGDEEQVEVLH